MRQLLQARFVLYDGGCGSCRRTLRLLDYLDVFHQTVPYDVSHDWAETRRLFSQLSPEACLRDLHVVRADGKTFAGFEAYRSLAWVLPAMWPIVPLLYLPPVRWLGSRIYRRIADARDTCSIAR